VKRRTRAAILVAGATALLALGPLPTSEASPCASVLAAASTNHAGLVVQFADGSMRQFCIPFTESSVTGLDLLVRSGLPLRYQDYGGGSVAVCMIGGVGCDYPSKPCFCQCSNPNKSCRFWGYYVWNRSTGAWSYSSNGAGTREVHNGDMDGWRWGEHRSPNPPPASTFAAVCSGSSTITPPPSSKAKPPKTSGAPTSTATPPNTSETRSPTTVASDGARIASSTPAGATVSLPTDRAISAPPDRGGHLPITGIAVVVGFGVGLGLWGARRFREARRVPP